MRFSPGKVSNVADLLGLGYGFRGFKVLHGDCFLEISIGMAGSICMLQILNESNNLFLQREGGSFSDYSVRFKLNPVCEPYTGFGIKKSTLIEMVGQTLL